MDPNQNELLRETLRLTQENNKMLHAMRRRAFVSGIIKFIFYVLVLIVAPVWLYMTYLSPIMNELSATVDQVRGTGAKAQLQFEDFQDVLKQFQSQFRN